MFGVLSQESGDGSPETFTIIEKQCGVGNGIDSSENEWSPDSGLLTFD